VKHGATEADIRFAFDNKLFDHPVARQEEKNLLIGFDVRLNFISAQTPSSHTVRASAA
jgi:hypothetical protein